MWRAKVFLSCLRVHCDWTWPLKFSFCRKRSQRLIIWSSWCVWACMWFGSGDWLSFKDWSFLYCKERRCGYKKGGRVIDGVFGPQEKQAVFSDEVNRAELCNIFGESFNLFCIVLIRICFGSFGPSLVFRCFWFGQSFCHRHQIISAPGLEVTFWQCETRPNSYWEDVEILVTTARCVVLVRSAYLVVVVVLGVLLLLERLETRYNVNRS